MPTVAAGLRGVAALLGVLVVTLGSIVLLSGSPAFACSCVMSDVPQQAGWASEVFVGTVTATQEDGGPLRGDELVVYDVAVDRVWKGNPSSTVTVESASNSASCGVPDLPEGREVAFFVRVGAATGEDGEGRSTDLCGGTGVLTGEIESELTATLGDPYPAGDIPEAPTPGTPVTREEAMGDPGAEHDPLLPLAAEIALAGAVLAFPAVLLVVIGLRRRRGRLG